MRLRVCGQTVPLSTDDLSFPAGASLIAHFVCGVSLLAILASNYAFPEPSSPTKIVVAAAALSLFTSGIDYIVARMSSSGTIANGTRREGVSMWFTWRLVLAICELSTVAALVQAFYSDSASVLHPAIYVALAMAMFFSTLVNVFFVLIVGLLLCCTQRQPRSSPEMQSQRWASILEGIARAPLCCLPSRQRSVGQAGPGPFLLAGTVVAGVLEMTASLSLTASDIIAGLALVHAAQVEEEREANEAVLALRRTLRRVGSENQEAMQIPSKLSQSLPSEASQARISNGHDSAQNAAGSETSAAARPRSRLQHFATTASRLRMAASRAKQVLKNSQSQSTEMGVWSALDQQRSAVLRHHYGKLHNTLGSSALNVSDPEQVLMLDECAHFAGFAIAASGWRLQQHIYTFACPCRMCVLASIYSSADACEHVSPQYATALCCCSPSFRAARSAKHDGRTRATAELLHQLDPENLASRHHYHGSANHGLPPDRILCPASDGDTLGCNDHAVRVVIEEACARDLRACAAAGAAKDAASPAPHKTVKSTKSLRRVLSRVDSQTMINLPASSWADDATSHTPGVAHLPFPLPETGSLPFHRTDILHSCYDNQPGRAPWFVAVDRTRRALVVSVRGTNSYNDAITDALAVPFCVSTELGPSLEHLASLGLHVAPEHAYVHEGMWQAARAIEASLMQHGLLEAAEHLDPPCTWCDDDSDAPADGLHTGEGAPAPLPRSSASGPVPGALRGLQLVLTGHSLGAGIAALLGLLLLPSFPGLRCYAISPPGALASAPLAAAMEAFVLSTLVGSDIVPRMSLPNVKAMVAEVAHSMARAKASKPAIFAAVCCGIRAKRDAHSRGGLSALVAAVGEPVPGADPQYVRTLLAVQKLQEEAQRECDAIDAAMTIPASNWMAVVAARERAVLEGILNRPPKGAAAGLRKEGSDSSMSRHSTASGSLPTPLMKKATSTMRLRMVSAAAVARTAPVFTAHASEQSLAATTAVLKPVVSNLSPATPLIAAPFAKHASRLIAREAPVLTPRSPRTPRDPPPASPRVAPAAKAPPAAAAGAAPAAAAEPHAVSQGNILFLRMHAPGRLLHMAKVGKVPADIASALCAASCGPRASKKRLALANWAARVFCCCLRREKHVYEPRWISRENLGRIRVATSAAADHMPDKIWDVLQQAARDVRLAGGGSRWLLGGAPMPGPGARARSPSPPRKPPPLSPSKLSSAAAEMGMLASLSQPFGVESGYAGPGSARGPGFNLKRGTPPRPQQHTPSPLAGSVTSAAGGGHTPRPPSSLSNASDTARQATGISSSPSTTSASDTSRGGKQAVPRIPSSRSTASDTTPAYPFALPRILSSYSNASGVSFDGLSARDFAAISSTARTSSQALLLGAGLVPSARTSVLSDRPSSSHRSGSVSDEEDEVVQLLNDEDVDKTL